MGYICPFLNNVQNNNESFDNTCIQSLCKFWVSDSTNEECMYITQSQDVRRNYLLMQHIHDKHLHIKEHFGENQTYGSPYGIKNYTNVVPKAVLLMSEFTSNMDLDGDGRIYGVDFSIKSDDDEPMILSALKNNPSWPASIPIEINWKVYLGTL